MANHPTPYHTITTIIVIDHDGEDISILSNTEYGPYEDLPGQYGGGCGHGG